MVASGLFGQFRFASSDCLDHRLVLAERVLDASAHTQLQPAIDLGALVQAASLFGQKSVVAAGIKRAVEALVLVIIGIRIAVLCGRRAVQVDLLQRADAIVREEIRSAGLEREIWQAFAVLPDIRSVGVMGDERTYGYPAIIRAVTSEDAMTADWARLPYDLLERMSSRIINEVDGINRVAYDVTSKPPGTIEWE